MSERNLVAKGARSWRHVRVVAEQSSPLGAGGTSTKTHAPGVGLIVSSELELVEWR